MGCGTFEALAVALAFPEAKEVLAIDLSQSSLRRLAWRVRLARASGRRFAPIQQICADIMTWEPTGDFSLIFAANVLHHLPDPAAGLARVASWLKPGGFLRLVTYPRASRIWMRETSRQLKLAGLSAGQPRLLARSREAIAALPTLHPAVSCFFSHPEVVHPAGLIDAFFNAQENPLSPLAWRTACAAAGLRLVREDQTDTSRSDFLIELVPETRTLDAWERLEILDRLLELCANPVLWLQKMDAPEPNGPFADEPLSNDYRSELGQHLRVARDLLARVNLPLKRALDQLAKVVGPRVTADGHGAALPGLSIIEYDADELIGQPRRAPNAETR